MAEKSKWKRSKEQRLAEGKKKEKVWYTYVRNSVLELRKRALMEIKLCSTFRLNLRASELRVIAKKDTKLRSNVEQ